MSVYRISVRRNIDDKQHYFEIRPEKIRQVGRIFCLMRAEEINVPSNWDSVPYTPVLRSASVRHPRLGTHVSLIGAI